MGTFLSYMLASALVIFALRALDSLTGSPAIDWLRVVSYLALAGGLFWLIWRHVKKRPS